MNDGGPASLLRLQEVPRLEQETAISAESVPALAAWLARPGEVLTLVDPQNHHYRARLIDIGPEHPRCVPFERLWTPVESPLKIHVFHALPEKERFELVLEKLTELGVVRIIPMESAHSSTLEARDSQQKKSHRWPHLLGRASRQCRRAMLPELFAPVDFHEAIAMAATAELKMLCYEGESSWSLLEGVGQLRPESVALMIGPEGGFSEAEVLEARDAGILPVRLGPRILRTETAAIAATALLQGLIGDLG